MGERKHNKKSFLYRLGAFFASMRASFLEGFYSVHVKVRYLHDKTYQKGGVYKKWTDKPYSNTVHKTALWGFILSFTLTSLAQSLWPYLFNPTKPRTVYAGANSVTWTSKNDFTSNAVTGGTAGVDGIWGNEDDTKPTTRTGATISEDGKVTGTPDSYLRGVTQVSSGRYHSVALTDQGKVLGWGQNSYGAIAGDVIYGSVPGEMNITNATYVSAGWNNTFVIKNDGSVWVYGSNVSGQRGVDSVGTDSTSVAVQVKDPAGTGFLTGINQISVGNDFVIAKKTDGTLLAWGENGSGQLGLGVGDTTDRYLPTLIPGMTNVKFIETGSTQSYAILNDGTLYAWGSGLFGMGATNESTVPVLVNTIDNLKNISASGTHVLAVKEDGTGWAWGGNSYGALGVNNGFIDSSSTPLQVKDVGDNPLAGVAYMAPNHNSFYGGQASVAVLNDGTVLGAGNNSVNGSGTYAYGFRVIGSGGTSVAGSAYYLKYLKSDGTLLSWGLGYGCDGGFGGGCDYTANRPYPTYVSKVGGVTLYTDAVISNMKIDSGAGIKSDWSTINWNINETLPANTSVTFQTRGTNVASPNGSTLSDQANPDDGWTTFANLVGVSNDNLAYSGNVQTSATRWLEIKVTLASSDDLATATLNDFTVTYNTINAPSAVASYKSDNTEINVSNTNNYTNESSVTVKGSVAGIEATDALTPQFEVRTDTNFTGSPAVPAGVIVTVPNDLLGTPNEAATLGTISGLSPGSAYYYRVRLVDQAGRVSAWDSSDPAKSFSVEQTAPTISSFTIGGDNVQNGFAKLTSVTLNVSASDTGGSTLSKMRFSNDGVFNEAEDPAEAWVNYNSSYAWTLASGDGQKTVYAQVKDAAGNTSGTWTQNTTEDFNAGEKNVEDLTVLNNSFYLNTHAPETVTIGSQTWMKYNLNVGQMISGGSEQTNNGIVEKYCYGNDPDKCSVYGGLYQWNEAMQYSTAEGSQGACPVGFHVPTNDEFTQLERNICTSGTCNTDFPFDNTTLGWRGTDEGTKLKAGGSSDFDALMAGRRVKDGESYYFSHNDSVAPYTSDALTYFFSSSMYNGQYNLGRYLSTVRNDIARDYEDGTGGYSVRCIKDAGNSFLFESQLTSSTKDNSSPRNYGNILWSATVPQEAGENAVRFQVASNNDNSTWNFIGPDGTAGTYYSTTGAKLHSSHNGHRYIRYKAFLQTASIDHTPTVFSVSIEVNTTNSAQITLDTQAPAAFSLTSPANNTWQQSATPTLTWNASSDPDPDGEGPAEPSGISKYQIYVCSVSPLPSPCPAESFVLNRDNISPTETTVSATPSPALTQRKHTWKIRAFDTAGNYTDSTESWNLGYDAQPPSKALDPGFSLTATDSQSDRITVSWSPPYADDSGNGSPAASYSLERITYSDYAGGVGLPEGQTHTTTSNWSLAASYTDLGIKSSPFDQTTLSGAIQASVKYIYRIKVTDAAGNISGWLVTDTGLTADTQAPNPPSNTVADACDGQGVYDSGSNPTGTCSNVGNEGFEIKLSWTAATDTGTGVTGYKIYRKYGSNSYNENDFSLVGYKDVDPPGSPIDTVYFDNDSNNDATFSDDINGEIVNIKNASTSRLIDSEVYFYRIVAIDDAGQENDVILIGNDNYATATTPDVTNPTPSSEVVATAMGIDGLPVPPNEDPKQKIAVTWNASTDLRAGGRIPAGNGSGIKYYSIYYATSSGHLDPVDSSTIQNWNLIASDIAPTTPTVSYPHNQLLEMTWYYYKIVAEDKSEGQSQGRLSGDAYSEPVKTLSSQVPTTPSEVSVVAAKGNPATDANVGRKVTVSFKSSYIKFSTNKITGFEVYRATTNWNSINDWLDPQKTTKLSLAEFENLNITGLDIIPEDIQDTLTVYSFIDTVPADSATYYYKVRATGYNPTNNPTTVISGLSQISTGVIGEGWDVVPDATAPDLPSELKVKDIHGDGVNYLRNIITWSRIVTPTRNGQNDFKEYRLYRSNDGLVWTQVLVNGNNPLYNANKELALATNYYIDLIANADSNQYYYYYITAVDDAATEFKYPQPAGAAVINSFANESAPVLDGEGKVVSVSLNPAIAQPSITTLPSGKKGALQSVGVSSAVITWTTDQPCDSLVEYRKTGTSEKFIAAGDTELRNNHTVTLKALDPMTTYEYRILSRNYLANTARAEGNDVPTLATNGFTITPGEVKTTTSTTEIAWSTNLDASSAFVEYQLQRQPGDTAQSGTAGVSLEQLAANAKSHNVVIKGLRSNRTYTYKIKSISTDGFLAETGFLTFKSRSFDSEQFTLTPSSSNVAERNITATTAQIVWQTSMQTTSWVDYSTRSGTYDMSSGNNDLNTQHAVVIEGLVPGTKYFYRVRVKDANEVEYTSQEYTFTAVLKPKISNLRVSEVTPYSVVIEWETNVETETILNWGKTAGYGEKRGKNEMVKLHKIKVDGLEDNTEYHYQILAKDSNGNEVADDDKIIRTPVDTEGPKIIDVKTDILPMGEADETATVIITWKTNKPATTQVLYDEGIVGNKMSDSTTEDLSLNLSHSVIIRDLTAGSTYRFRVVSADKRGNKTISNDFNFMTPSKEKSILQLIVKSLEETFGWVKNVGQFFSKLGKKTK